ncbi:MAG TPA: carboxyl transferase domain-containing protein, partial [Vineibacter sp.]|nr:carboxyl transferase domain-containing protein [Vineibacter sp.]
MSWQPELDELKRRQALVARMGGPDKVKRQHDGGRLTVRERIDRLLDPGSFREFGSIAGMATYDGKNDLSDLVASNSVTGRGTIDGRPVAVSGDDFTVRGGSADATIKEKNLLVERMAYEYRMPLIRLIEGSGGGGSVKTIETTGRANVPGVIGFDVVAANMGAVPVVALGLGSVAGLGAARLAAA